MVTAQDIRRARSALGESQQAFARRFGVNQATVSKWERRVPTRYGTTKAVIERGLREIAARRETQEPDN